MDSPLDVPALPAKAVSVGMPAESLEGSQAHDGMVCTDLPWEGLVSETRAKRHQVFILAALEEILGPGQAQLVDAVGSWTMQGISSLNATS